MTIVTNVRLTGTNSRRSHLARRRPQQMLFDSTMSGWPLNYSAFVVGVVVIAVVAGVARVDASDELHPAHVGEPLRRAGGVYTSSFLVRFHRSVDRAEAERVAQRHGFESVGAVSRSNVFGDYRGGQVN